MGKTAALATIVLALFGVNKAAKAITPAEAFASDSAFAAVQFDNSVFNTEHEFQNPPEESRWVYCRVATRDEGIIGNRLLGWSYPGDVSSEDSTTATDDPQRAWFQIDPGRYDSVRDYETARDDSVRNYFPVSVRQNDRNLPERVMVANHPNPFNNSTAIDYSVEEKGKVSLSLYDTNGRMVKKLVDGRKTAGNYSVELNAGDLPAGTYVMRLRTKGRTQVSKMTHLK